MKRLLTQLAMLITISTVALGNSANLSQVYEIQLKKGWAVESSAKIKAAGEAISKPGFDASKWHKCQVPSTVMAALISNNVYPDIFMGDNISKVDTSQFRVPWWYRTEFTVNDQTRTSELIFEGINYRANVWLNGIKIASSDSLFGGFRIFKINVSKQVKAGKNALAVQIFHQLPSEPSIGFVDWAPMAPDREMGIWRPVKLRTSGNTVLDNIFVKSKITYGNTNVANLQIETDVINHTNKTVNAVVKGKIDNISIEKRVALAPNQKSTVVFSSDEFAQLNIKNPRLWWTHDLGKPDMYNLKMEVFDNGKLSYAKNTRFGIREVSDYINAQGHRGYKLNGKEILIKGGGWVDGMFLNDSEQKVKTQMEYVKHTNMNTIRLEGFWGNSQRFYELADEMGILLMAGWSCQWEWASYLDKPEEELYMSIKTPEDIKLIVDYTRDHVLWLRNHPSIFAWVMGSDKLPRPELELQYNDLFRAIDPTRPLLMSCKSHTSTISGPSAVKMNGPYDYVSPNYWYLDTKNGGAFGFNTETGPGPQVPSLNVLKNMIPEDKLWPINKMWDFHCGRFAFETLDRYLVAFNNRYGEQHNVEDFTFKSQASNLEAMRAMFEAFAINRSNTTGIIQWMYNSAWPKLIWQLWDYYLQPNAAYYGARIGARPVNIAYNYGNNAIYITNLSLKDQAGLTAQVQLIAADGKILSDKKIAAGNVAANTSLLLLQLPDDKAYTDVYFLKARLFNSNHEQIADNFYWLSTQKDEPDFDKTTWINTPLKGFANFKGLDKLPAVKLESSHNFTLKNNQYHLTVTIKNPSSTIAFLVEMNVIGSKSGKPVIPTFWEDNYISLTPGETRIVKASFPASALNGEKPVYQQKGWNTK